MAALGRQESSPDHRAITTSHDDISGQPNGLTPPFLHVGVQRSKAVSLSFPAWRSIRRRETIISSFKSACRDFGVSMQLFGTFLRCR